MDAGVLLNLAFDLDSVPRSNPNSRFDLKTFFWQAAPGRERSWPPVSRCLGDPPRSSKLTLLFFHSGIS